MTDAEALLEAAWQALEDGASRRKALFHLATLASRDSEGAPRVRTLVLRRVERRPARLRFHTDTRSAKWQGLELDDRAEACFHHPDHPLQVRAAGRAVLLSQGEVWAEAWQGTPTMSRRCYCSLGAPGSPLDDPARSMPEELRDRRPTLEESEAGRDRFGVLILEIETLDILSLDSTGHRRLIAVGDALQWVHP
ncbi:MAG: pyridoxamine 5'-phosphate oxidase family protein [Fimbriimonadaceae bacterium]|nr:pyridoxamine 5'-phosphate oxidase family protein [Fimbriimonadaceae bacterium]